MYNGYDNNGIKRVFGETIDDCRQMAREYFQTRPEIKFIRFLKLGKNGRPMMQGQFKIYVTTGE